jgi:hypothetical protein
VRPTTPPDAVSLEVADLRRKFLGPDADARAPYYGAEPTATDSADAIVLTRPKTPPADPTGGPGPKAVVISGGKVIARQG